MPTRIDFGEVAERIRRVLRLSGRINTRVDENVTVVALLDALNVDPYRAEPRTFAQTVTVAAGAATVPVVFLKAAPAVQTPVFTGELLLVDRVIIDAPGGAAGSDQFWMGLVRPGLAIAGQTVVNFIPVLNTPGRGGGVPQVLASQVLSSTPASVSSGTAGVAFQLLDCQGPAIPTIYEGELSQPIVLYPGDQLAVADTVVNKRLNVNFIGRAFDPSFLSR